MSKFLITSFKTPPSQRAGAVVGQLETCGYPRNAQLETRVTGNSQSSGVHKGCEEACCGPLALLTVVIVCDIRSSAFEEPSGVIHRVSSGGLGPGYFVSQLVCALILWTFC